MLPIIRTFISLPAGLAKMPFWRFTWLTAIGSLPWVIGFGGYAAARVDAWIVGAGIAVLSLWALTEGGTRREPRHPKPTA